MNYLKRQLNEAEKYIVGGELERLFMLQDKHLDDKKKNMLLKEISDMGVPADAAIKGIKALCNADMRNLKFVYIKDSINACNTFVVEKTDCIYCEGRGTVSMVNKKRTRFLFACCCEAGKSFKHLAQWNGSIVMGKFALYEVSLLGGVAGCKKWLIERQAEFDAKKAVAA